MTAPDESVVVVGGGTMGSGIVQRFLQAGYYVTCVEVDDARAAQAAATVRSGLSRWATKQGQPALANEAGQRLALHTGGPVDLPDGPKLVVETVSEAIELKREILGGYAKRFPGAIIATNTSALSIDELAGAVDNPGRFVGMHFFNPVPLSALLEIVRGSATEAKTLTKAKHYAELLALSPIEVRDSPGFATSRLGIAIGLEAIRMVEEDVASAADIDTGMMLGYRFPIGPLELSDRVGLDVRLAIAEHLHATIGPRFEPPKLLRTMVQTGQLGMKTGTGFYHWDGATKLGANPGLRTT